MMIQKSLRTFIFLTCLVMMPYVRAMFPINFFRPWDENVVRPYRARGAWLDVTVTPEFGLKTIGRTSCDVSCLPPKDGPEVNVLHIYQPEQDALAMLKGFNPNSTIGMLAQQLNVDDDNGVRGHFNFCGDLDIKNNTIFSTRFFFPHDFIIGLYIPVVSLKLTTKYTDLTQAITQEDILTQELLTDNFAQNILDLGGPNIKGWEKTGIGDIAAMVDWARNFPQSRPLLKNVRARVRGGMSFPTGPGIDPDEIFSIPLGLDKAFGLIFGAGLDISLTWYFKLGVDVEFLYLFNNTRVRRIKTDPDQTDLILLAKTNALKDFGLVQRFNLYGELFKLSERFTFRFTYQFWKQDDNHLAVCGNTYSSIPANTAKSLEEWTMHNFIYNLSYDFDKDLYEKSPVMPYLALFYKQPINGKNAVLAHTMGFIASISY